MKKFNSKEIRDFLKMFDTIGYEMCEDIRGLEFYIHAEEGVDLSNTDFACINIPHSDIQMGKFDKSDLQLVDLSNSILCRSSFVDTNMESVNLEGANCRECNFTNADLSDANLIGCNFTGAVFEGANLDGVEFTDCILDNANFAGAKNFGHSQYGGASIIDCKSAKGVLITEDERKYLEELIEEDELPNIFK